MRQYVALSGLMFFLLLFSSADQLASAQILPILGPPTNLAAQAVSTSRINLSWNAPSSLGGLVLTGYEIERSTNGGSWSVLVYNTGTSSTVYSDTGLSPDTMYSYRVSAITILVTSSPSNTASATTYSPVTAPSSPTGLSAVADSTSRITLDWNAPSSNGGSAITGYEIERSSDGGSTWSTISSNTGSTSTSYSDTGLSPSTTYSYRVSAINSAGTSSPSNTASATTYAQMSTPQSPTGLSASGVSPTQIDLSWNAPANDGGSQIVGYKIERSTGGGSWSVIDSNTGDTGTEYSDTGLSENTSYSYRVSAINGVGTSSPSNTASATTTQSMHTITSVKSGLVTTDSLTNETKTKDQLVANQKYWHYGGSATVENAPYDIFKDTQGLHIGVQAPSNGTWAGYYAVSSSSDASLFHAVITTPTRTIHDNFYENGLYIQTASQNVNYVTCFSDTSTTGTVWAVVSATGNANGATQFNVLYVDQSPNQPLTRDCTIITNGDNYLKVYLDGTMVYSNSALNLQMPSPLIAFLEPQTSYIGDMLYGTYKDYYSATGEDITVINNPSNAARADVVNSAGTVIATSPVVSGTATLDIAQYHFPLSVRIQVYDSSNNMMASSEDITNMFGGDVYKYN